MKIYIYIYIQRKKEIILIAFTKILTRLEFIFSRLIIRSDWVELDARVAQRDVYTQARVKHVRARRGEQKRVYCYADMAELPSHSPSSSFHHLPSFPRFTSLFYWIFMI